MANTCVLFACLIFGEGEYCSFLSLLIWLKRKAILGTYFVGHI